jgi:DNA repair protein RadC
MSSNAQHSSGKRYQRYLPLLEFLNSHAEITIDEFKGNWPDETPAFLTRIVTELSKQGWLVRESDDTSYRWNRDKGEFSVNAWLDQKLYGSQVKSAPQQDRPRERLLAAGAESLKTSELIAILVRSGLPGESAVMAGEKVANEYQHKLDSLPSAGRGELNAVSKAIVSTAYCQIMAGIELGRRVAAAGETRTTSKIMGSDDAIVFCQRRFSRLALDQKQEEFHIVTLDTKNQVIDTHQITVGTLDASLVHPREVFKAAIKDSAASIILVHNHPSGDPTPSRADIDVTNRLTESGKLLGIEVLDHIVLGREKAISIRASE